MTSREGAHTYALLSLESGFKAALLAQSRSLDAANTMPSPKTGKEEESRNVKPNFQGDVQILLEYLNLPIDRDVHPGTTQKAKIHYTLRDQPR